MKLISKILVVVFAMLQYLQMCIASINENYQVGIEKIQFFQPTIIILFLILLTIFASGKAGQVITKFTKCFYRLALVVCLILLIFFLINDFTNTQSYWSYPHQRTLAEALKISLIHPDFSARSLGVLLNSFVLLFALVGVVKIKKKRNIA